MAQSSQRKVPPQNPGRFRLILSAGSSASIEGKVEQRNGHDFSNHLPHPHAQHPTYGEDTGQFLGADIESQSPAQQLNDSKAETEELLASIASNLLDPIRFVHKEVETLLKQQQQQQSGSAPARVARSEHELTLQKLANTTKHLSHAISDVVDFHLVAKTRVQSEIINLKSLIPLIAESVFSELDPATIIVGSMPDVRADPSLLIRALSHLINFSRGYAKPGEALRIRIGFSNSQQSFVLSDNSTGVDMRLINRLMNLPFTDTHTMKKGLGESGRSLAVAKKIMTMHGGAFEVISIMGVGTTCYFQLPLVVEMDTSY